ncbi:MAG: dTDP-4-dehydrorhamnose 3,5-epimerase family protein [Fimbriimonadaceae bacterium]|nr:dTDP-4-dehydrorhamnose 3,5-epimerase family protein [Fimbriimonadaceae bacterium]
MSESCRRGKIAGVWRKAVRTFTDDRGLLGELLRTDDPYYGNDFAGCAQTTLTMSYPGVIKAFHWHRAQDDAWFCVRGMIQAVLYDLRSDSPTRGVTEQVAMGEYQPILLVIPRGVAHGYRVLGEQPAWLVYHTSALYDPTAPDEERIAWDDPSIAFDWSTRPR